jgi:hypothetical protein
MPIQTSQWIISMQLIHIVSHQGGPPTRKQQEVFRIEQDLLELPRSAMGHNHPPQQRHIINYRKS